MQKILPLLIVGILVLSGLGAVGTNNVEVEIQSDSFEISFSSFTIEEYNQDYVELNFEEVSTYISEPCKPMLPKVVNTFELPFGVTNVKVEVTPKNIVEQEIVGKIKPAPTPLPLTALSQSVVKTETTEIDEEIYMNTDPYPDSWFSYRVGCGLNENMERVTHVSVHTYPARYIPASDKLLVAESADIKITYEPATVTLSSVEEEFDLVIIAPKKFKNILVELKQHKDDFGIKTFIKTTESIYGAYEGADKPEKIKRFIDDAIQTNDITYVLLVGGLKSKIWNEPRDHMNYGDKWWYVPVRYTNFYDDPKYPLSFEKIYDPGFLCDLYYADVYGEGGVFQDWDSNGDGKIAVWGMDTKGFDIENDTNFDFYPDVALGRLACRSKKEVRDVVNKIIRYEETAADPDWFKKVVTITGDGFMDQEDLDIQWNTTELDEGEYTIKAQSSNPNGEVGPVDKITVTIDRSVETLLTFNHDDWERIPGYPFSPIADIVSVSDGDILGNTNYFYEPKEGEAYGNSQNGWANLNFSEGVLHIRGKTYDPRPYGNVTDIRVWVENEDMEIIFEDWRYDQEMYYEGEWICGEKTLLGGGGATYYMPEEFDIEHFWASNGKLNDKEDYFTALNPGSGFAFFSGHGSPNVWSDHYPGIPGNRRHGSIPSFSLISFKHKVIPVFPMKRLTNKDKLPIILVGGCHNSQFNVSMIPGLLDRHNEKNTWCHGTPLPECFSWYLVKMPRTGAIATIGNTGLGYGAPGKITTTEGLDGGICIEFFKEYGIQYEDNSGAVVLGDVCSNVLTNYADTYDIELLDHAKSLTQWTLLGDPSLMIGGYS
jgi:hypothetical protein